MPLFLSIIVATRDAAGTLPRLLDSLVTQTCRDFEVILQDGDSRDNTAKIAAAYCDTLTIVWNSEKDSGIYDAWNKALAHMKGEWALFLGADDKLYGDDVVAKTRQFIGEAKCARGAGEALLFASGGVVATSAEGIPLRYISGKVCGAVASLRAMEIPAPFPGLFIHGSLLKQPVFDASFRIAGDYEFLCKAWTHDDFCVRLPYLVTSMQCGGISDQSAYDAVIFKEITDAAQAHYGERWTPARRRQFLRAKLSSWLWRYFPRQAAAVDERVHVFRGKGRRITSDGARLLPSFSPQDVPIFIVSFNRLHCLEQLVSWLEQCGFENIIIVDNNSTYEPLLQYLEKTSHQTVRLSENLGHLAVWKCGLFERIVSSEYYIVTDPDVIPVAECPEDAILQFYNYLVAYPRVTKCGFSLCLDDIPKHYPLRGAVLDKEKKYWGRPLAEGNSYFADIDTTFALYRPGILPGDDVWFSGIRLAPPYTARHLPWYADPESMTDEDIFYQNSIQGLSSVWSINDINILKMENIRLHNRIHELESYVELLQKSFKNQIVLIVHKALKYIKKMLFE